MKFIVFDLQAFLKKIIHTSVNYREYAKHKTMTATEEAWRWGRTFMAFLVIKVNHWDMEQASYYVASYLRYLGLLSLTEGRANVCLAVLVAGKQTGGERGEFNVVNS